MSTGAAPDPRRPLTTPPKARHQLDVEDLFALVPGPPAPAVHLTGTGSFASAFDVDRAVFGAAGAANTAFGVAELDRDRALGLCAGKASVNGVPVPSWAELSGYYDTRDGRTLQLHCNFPHHAAGVVDELGCDPTRAAVESAVARRDGADLEAALTDRGMIAALVRSLAEWEGHPHAQATAGLDLISVERIGEGQPRPPRRRLRVLDCSRVLAGPVAAMLFGAHGADVLRVGSADLPSVDIGVLTTGSGKRNAFVELDTDAGRSTMHRLIDDADVWIDAYRPGSLADRGFGIQSVAPGGIVVQLSAFDWLGPWGGRRGFDSIVQSTTGIVHAGSTAAESDRPVPLPVQALDYCTGLLAAFAARRLVDHQAAEGGTWLARLSLLRTRDWLVSFGGPTAFSPKPVTPSSATMTTVPTPFGDVTTALPISGSWPHGPQPLGSSTPDWLRRGERRAPVPGR